MAKELSKILDNIFNKSNKNTTKNTTDNPIDNDTVFEKIQASNDDGIDRFIDKGLIDQATNQSGKTYNFINQKSIELSYGYSLKFAPHISGRNMIFMDEGPWLDFLVKDPAHFDNIKFDSNDSKNNSVILGGKKEGIINKISPPVSLRTFTGLEKTYTKFPQLFTGIDLPNISKIYQSVSTKNQSLNSYIRENILGDFSITSLENNGIEMFRYISTWFKAIELIKLGADDKLDPSKYSSFQKKSLFYNVPYSNAVWVLMLDLRNEIRGIIFLPGVLPVNLPLKEVVGQREQKMVTYNLQFKCANVYYKTFSGTQNFLNQLGDEKNLLENLFYSRIISKN